VQGFVIGLLPLIFAMMYIPGMTKKYGTMALDLLMWLAFWGPVASVVNFIVQDYARYSLQSGTDGEITFQTMQFLVAHGHTLMAVAGYIMFSVPMIAFALANGSAYAMVGMVSGVTGLSTAAARSASTKLSTDEGAQAQAASAIKMEEYGKLKEMEKTTGMSAQEAYLKNADMMAGDVAARAKFMQMMDWSKYMQAQMNNLAHQAGSNLAYGNMSNAFAAGQLQTQSALGNIMGAYQAYLKSGSKESFAQWVSGQSEYKSTALAEQVRAMQNMADKFFGGDLRKEMAFLSNVEAIRNVGGAIGAKEFYDIAKRYGLSPVQAEALLEGFHKQGLLGQVFADLEGIATTGGKRWCGFLCHKTLRPKC